MANFGVEIVGFFFVSLSDLQLHGDDVYYTLENASLESGFQRDGGIRHNPSLPKVSQRALVD